MLGFCEGDKREGYMKEILDQQPMYKLFKAELAPWNYLESYVKEWCKVKGKCIKKQSFVLTQIKISCKIDTGL
jgi:hypothetical protein